MSHQNNFDIIRLFLVSTVFFVHSYILTGVNELRLLQVLSSEFAIHSFFVISGFLVFMSYQNSKSLSHYINKRIRRIYPAYFIAVSIPVLIGYFFSNAKTIDLFKYLGANLLFLNFIQPNVPGIFDSNRMNAINGSLWIIKIEVAFYSLVPLFAFIMKHIGKFAVFVSIYLLSVLYHCTLTALAYHSDNNLYLIMARQFPGQLSYFMTGVLLYQYFEVFKKRSHFFLLLAIITYCILKYCCNVMVLYPLYPLAVGVIIIYVATCLPWIGNFGKYGDMSYGIYLYHFPILQAVIAAGLFGRYPIISFGITILLVLLASCLSWHLVEKRFLLRSSHYIIAGKK